MTSKLITKTTLTTGLALSLTLGLFNSPNYAQEIYIDESCKPSSQQFDTGNNLPIFYQSSFKNKGETYLFYAGRANDYAAILCLSKPKFKQAKLLNNLKLIQFNYIDKIKKDPNNRTVYIIDLHEGNGDAYYIRYRLNFVTPYKAVITKLKTWR